LFRLGLIQTLILLHHVEGKKPCQGYKAENIKTSVDGLTADLLLKEDCSKFGKDVDLLKLTVRYETDERIHVKIEDKDKKQFQVPESIVPLQKPSKVPTALKYQFRYKEDPFSFQIVRPNDGTVVFDTTGKELVFEDQYLEISSELPNNANIFGLGEAVDTFRRNPEGTVQTMWARDAADPVRENIYGSQPVYFEIRKGKAHGVLFLNNHGMDISLKNSRIQYSTIGGVLDFYFFMGESPLAAVEQLTDLIGKPHMVPYWSLGFHQCRYGYKNIQEVAQVVENYRKENIPLETMWTDIDYMDKFKDFTLDADNFPLEKVQKLVKDLHSNNQKYVMILDPAIGRDSSYKTYTDGLERDIFVKNRDDSVYYGHVWPGYSAFPDWFHPDASNWWYENIAEFLKKVPLDGLWIDMNEAASFCFGSCGTGKPEDVIPPLPWDLPNPPQDPIYSGDEPDFNYLNPQYSINNRAGNLSDRTIQTNATHHGGILEYDVHNLYGHMEAIATREALLKINPTNKPFLIGRSTFIGSGVLEGHWTGDNYSNWEYLYWSIPHILSFQLFGIPFVGADICGFNGNTQEELCARWMELGAFYPFSRNHNTIGADSQEAYRWKSVAESSRKALEIRYTLLPYWYTLFYQANSKGTPVLRSLIWEWPNENSFLNNDKQFLLGSSILVTPVLTQGATSVDATIPPGIWYDWYDYKAIKGMKETTLDAPLGKINVHIRGGSIIPIQKPSYTTAESRKNPFKLIIALDENRKAKGNLYLDDGDSLQVGEAYSYLEFEALGDTLVGRGHFGYQKDFEIEKLIVLSPDKDMKEINFKSDSLSRLNTDSQESFKFSTVLNN